MSGPVIDQHVTGDNNIIAGSGNVNVNVTKVEPAAADELRDLAILRRRVEAFWIEDLLKSMQTVAAPAPIRRLVPWLVEQPLAPAHPRSATDGDALPPDRTMEAVFDACGQMLLIVGDPGSGKTTALLELARGLIVRAKDPLQPVPVVLQLSSWRPHHGTLFDWLVDELRSKYFVGRDAAKLWLRRRRLILLLDSLDETNESCRAACIQAINRFAADLGAPGLAVSCRLREYESSGARLRLNAAVMQASLDSAEVAAFLDRAGPAVASLRSALQSDTALQELARTPLMVQVLTEAYSGQSPDQLPSAQMGTGETTRDHLFESYIRRMFERGPTQSPPCSDQQARFWLSWLASRMIEQGKGVFLIEELQPEWLPRGMSRWAYALASRMATTTLLSLAIFGSLWMAQTFSPSFRARGGDVPLASWFALFLLFVAGGLLRGMTAAARINQKPVVGTARERRLRAVRRYAIWAAGGALLGWLSFLTDRESLVPDILLGALCALVPAWLFRRRRLRTDIRAAETWRWSWRRALKGAAWSLTVILPILIVVWNDPHVLGWGPRLLLAASYILLIGGLGALFGGMKTGVREMKTRPNQGMRLTLRTALQTGATIGAVGALCLGFGTILDTVYHPFAGLGSLTWHQAGAALRGFLTEMPAWFLTLAAIGATLKGGATLLRHGTLRLILRRRGSIPAKYAEFLDYCARLILLRKVGNGYVFAHRLLMEHFAARRGSQ